MVLLDADATELLRKKLIERNMGVTGHAASLYSWGYACDYCDASMFPVITN